MYPADGVREMIATERGEFFMDTKIHYFYQHNAVCIV
jgi:hypothetical protein